MLYTSPSYIREHFTPVVHTRINCGPKTTRSPVDHPPPPRSRIIYIYIYIVIVIKRVFTSSFFLFYVCCSSPPLKHNTLICLIITGRKFVISRYAHERRDFGSRPLGYLLGRLGKPAGYSKTFYRRVPVVVSEHTYNNGHYPVYSF